MDSKLTKHAIDLICKSPLDYWHTYINPSRLPYKESASSAFDKAFRMAVFNKTAFDVMYAKIPNLDRTTKQGKYEYNMLMESSADKSQIALQAKDYNAILQMAATLKNHQLGSLLASEGATDQLTTFDVDGVSVSFTPHYVKDNIIINLTSTADASESQFIKECGLFNWHRKAALQLEGCKLPVMIFIVVEKKEPFNIGIYNLDERAIEFGRESYKNACKVFTECLVSDKWPGSSPKITTVSLPEYMLK